MNVDELKKYMHLPELHQQLLGEYTGGYSLGIGHMVNGEIGLILQVEGSADGVPLSVQLDGEIIPVEAHGNFEEPRPL